MAAETRTRVLVAIIFAPRSATRVLEVAFDRAEAWSAKRRGIVAETDAPFRLRARANGSEQVFQIRKGKTRLTLATADSAK